jgi:hypothetical protein
MTTVSLDGVALAVVAIANTNGTQFTATKAGVVVARIVQGSVRVIFQPSFLDTLANHSTHKLVVTFVNAVGSDKAVATIKVNRPDTTDLPANRGGHTSGERVGGQPHAPGSISGAGAPGATATDASLIVGSIGETEKPLAGFLKHDGTNSATVATQIRGLTQGLTQGLLANSHWWTWFALLGLALIVAIALLLFLIAWARRRREDDDDDDAFMSRPPAQHGPWGPTGF